MPAVAPDKSIIDLEDEIESVLSGYPRPLREIQFMLNRAKMISMYRKLRRKGFSLDDAISLISSELNESFDSVKYVLRKWRYL